MTEARAEVGTALNKRIIAPWRIKTQGPKVPLSRAPLSVLVLKERAKASELRTSSQGCKSLGGASYISAAAAGLAHPTWPACTGQTRLWGCLGPRRRVGAGRHIRELQKRMER